MFSNDMKIQTVRGKKRFSSGMVKESLTDRERDGVKISRHRRKEPMNFLKGRLGSRAHKRIEKNVGIHISRLLTGDSDKMIYERLQKEFEAAVASQTEEIYLDGEQWNDGLLATIRERVHMEAERKAMSRGAGMLPDHHFHGKATYRVDNKVICCLEGARIGIQYETSFAGESRELYHCVLESRSFLEKMTVSEHTIPFFLPTREAENDLLSSNAMQFIDFVGELVQAYVDRREQVNLIKELYGNQIEELYHSLPYHVIEFVLNVSDCKVTVSLRYQDLRSILPTKTRVLAWPIHPSKKNTGIGSSNGIPAPSRLPYAEEALRIMALPEAYAEIVLKLPQALGGMIQHSGPVSSS
ncbi:hypothetical protein ACHQM5_030318 [Ranunculus cassubicifolius]